MFAERDDDEVYLRGQSLLRVHVDARSLLYLAGGLAALAQAFLWVRGRTPKDRSCHQCGALLRGPVGLHAFQVELTAEGAAIPSQLVAPGWLCEGCGSHGLVRHEEARLLLEDLVISCDFPAGSTHIGAEQAEARRRSQIWCLGVVDASHIPAPWLGRPTPGRRRFYRPAEGHRECYECDADGACYICSDRGARDCINCHGGGNCVVCRGMGEILDDAPNR